MSDTYSGFWRATVVGTLDPEGRGRVRVAVIGVHVHDTDPVWADIVENTIVFNVRPPNDAFGDNGDLESKSLGKRGYNYDKSVQSIQRMRDGPDSTGTETQAVRCADAYPWAEVMDTLGQDYYKVGDHVFVVFEHCNPEYPVVMGRARTLADVDPMSAPIPLPEDVLVGSEATIYTTTSMQLDYDVMRRRRMIRGKLGQLIEISDQISEQHVKLAAGEAAIVISAADDSIRTKSRGNYAVDAGSIHFGAKQIHILSDSSLILQAMSTKARLNFGSNDGDISNEKVRTDIGVFGAFGQSAFQAYGGGFMEFGQTFRLELLDQTGSQADGYPLDTEEVTNGTAITMIPSLTNQSEYVWIAPRVLELGMSCPKESFHPLKKRIEDAIGPVVASGSADENAYTQAFKPTRTVSIGATRHMRQIVNEFYDDPDRAAEENPVTHPVVGFVRVIARTPPSVKGNGLKFECDSGGMVEGLESGGYVLLADGPIFIGGSDVEIRPLYEFELVTEVDLNLCTVTKTKFYLTKQPPESGN